MRLRFVGFMRSLGACALSLFGSALSFVASLCLVFAIDQWPVYGKLVWPVSELLDAPINDVVLLALLALTTSLVPLVAMAILRPLRRETFGHTLLICGLLPLPTILMPNSEGFPLLLAMAGTGAGMFWWFAYRRPAVTDGPGQPGIAVAWTTVALSFVLIGGLGWQAHINEQQQAAARGQRIEGPQIWGGTAIGQDFLLYDSDGNATVRSRTGERVRSLPVKGVVAVKAADRASAFILSAPPLPSEYWHDGKIPAGAFTLSRSASGQLESTGPIAYEANARPWALAVHAGAPLVVSNNAIHIFDPMAKTWRRLTLSTPEGARLLRGDPAVAVSRDGRTLFVGFNKGEFGGGMIAINLATGEVWPIDARSSADLCAGPLNADCDPVTGVVPDPEYPRCVLASVGLWHMLTDGRIIRACPDSIRVVFDRALESPSSFIVRQLKGMVNPPRNPPSQTEPFFTLVEGQQDSIWAVSPYALYRRETTGWSRHALPEMVRHGAFSSGDAGSGVTLLFDRRNARFSMSGATPFAISDR